MYWVSYHDTRLFVMDHGHDHHHHMGTHRAEDVEGNAAVAGVVRKTTRGNDLCFSARAHNHRVRTRWWTRVEGAADVDEQKVRRKGDYLICAAPKPQKF